MGTPEWQVVDDDDGEILEIDLGQILPEAKFESKEEDPFKKVRQKNLAKRYKSKYQRLRKKFEGTEGTGTKYQDPEEIDGYGLFDAVEPPYNLEALANLYDDNATLRAVIDARTMNTVGLGHKWDQNSRARRKTEKLSGDEDKSTVWRNQLSREKEKLDEFLLELNEEDSTQDVLIKAVTDLLATGNGYIEIGRKEDGEIGYLGHIPSRLMRVRRERDGYVQTANGKQIFFRNYGDLETEDQIHDDPEPNECIHLKLYSSANNYYGVPPAIPAITAIMGDKYSKEYNLDYFENKAVPRYAIILKGFKLSEKSKRELISYFRNELKGRHHGTLVLPVPPTMGAGKDYDIKFEKLEVDVTDASFDKYRTANRDEIVTAYRVPPTKVSIFDNANLAVSRDADKTFKTQVVGPDQVMIEQRMNKIITELSDNLLWKFEQLDLLDDDMKSRINDRYLRTGTIAPNEVRQQVGLEATEGGDRRLTYAPEVKLITSDYMTMEGEEIDDDERLEMEQGREEMKQPKQEGQPFGNRNASQDKSPQDTAGQESSSRQATGEGNERGQEQEESGKERERE